MFNPTVSVVITSYRHYERLDRCLYALSQQYVSPKEVLVVDG